MTTVKADTITHTVAVDLDAIRDRLASVDEQLLAALRDPDGFELPAAIAPGLAAVDLLRRVLDWPALVYEPDGIYELAPFRPVPRSTINTLADLVDTLTTAAPGSDLAELLGQVADWADTTTAGLLAPLVTTLAALRAVDDTDAATLADAWVVTRGAVQVLTTEQYQAYQRGVRATVAALGGDGLDLWATGATR